MKKILLSLALMLACGACGDDNKDKDMYYPEISEEGIAASPVDCQRYYRGDEITVNYLFTDDTELGKYNVEIHHNFDHHTHSTSSVECEMDASKSPVHPWVYNKDFDIPTGKRSYNAQFKIPIPADIDPGDYHFMIRLTDKAGWQQLKAVAIKIME